MRRLAAAVALTAIAAGAQTRRVSGVVVDGSGAAVSQAEVTIERRPLAATTNAHGELLAVSIEGGVEVPYADDYGPFGPPPVSICGLLNRPAAFHRSAATVRARLRLTKGRVVAFEGGCPTGLALIAVNGTIRWELSRAARALKSAGSIPATIAGRFEVVSGRARIAVTWMSW